jgi:hypothetical protein
MDTLETSAEDSKAVETISYVFQYKDVEYTIEFGIDSNGDLIDREFPEELAKLDRIETLATVAAGEKIYFFDTEQESIDYFTGGKDLKRSASSMSASGSRFFSVSEFNYNVRAFEHDYFNGKKLNITKGYQLRDLSLVGFNDIMSSIGIETLYQNIYVGDLVTLYENKNFGGKSLKFICEFADKPNKCQLISGDSNNMIPGKAYRGHPKFRDIKFNLLRRWADKVSSIDVKFGGSSVVPPYPPSGGGGGGSGEAPKDPIK